MASLSIHDVLHTNALYVNGGLLPPPDDDGLWAFADAVARVTRTYIRGMSGSTASILAAETVRRWVIIGGEAVRRDRAHGRLVLPSPAEVARYGSCQKS